MFFSLTTPRHRGSNADIARLASSSVLVLFLGMALEVLMPAAPAMAYALTDTIESPAVSSVALSAIAAPMRLAQAHLKPEQLWVNPDCGLKTRQWDEVRPAIDAMVAAARTLRAEQIVEA